MSRFSRNIKSPYCCSGRAFTIMELLISCFILMLLAIIGFYGISAARKNMSIAINKTLINSLVSGLETYKTDFDKFPNSSGKALINSTSNDTEEWTGAHWLAYCLIGRARLDDESRPIDMDNVEGAGFRVKKRGKVYGPYIDPNVPVEMSKVPGDSDRREVITDYEGNPVLYYLANSGNSPRYDGTQNEDDNTDDSLLSGPDDGTGQSVDEYAMRGLVGDIDSRSDLPEYLLCSQGRDKLWWAADNVGAGVDDATNLPDMVKRK